MSAAYRAVIVLAALLGGCAGLIGIRDTTDETPLGLPDDDAPFDDEIGLDATAPIDDGGTVVIVDPGVDAGPCTPTRAFVPFASGPGSGSTCNPDGILPGATTPTGLDYVSISNYGALGPVNVTACVAAEMPSAVVQVRVRAAAVPQGCTRNCAGDYCGNEGWRAHVYVGTVGGALTWLAKIALSPTPSDFVLAVPKDVVGKHVVVCRTAANINSEDVQVHAVSGQCVP